MLFGRPHGPLGEEGTNTGMPGMQPMPGMHHPMPGIPGQVPIPPGGLVNLDIDGNPGLVNMDMGGAYPFPCHEYPHPCPPQPCPTIHVVVKGESVWSISKHYKVTSQSIILVNNLSNPDLIYPGQRLIVPLGQHYKTY